MELIGGIDEAGRGPLIGPLVMAGVSIKKENLKKLKELGVKDSKLLSKKRREILFKEILTIAEHYKIISLTPDIIDNILKDPNTNLNILEAQTTAKIIDTLHASTIYIDLPDKNKDRYCAYIKENMDCITQSNNPSTTHQPTNHPTTNQPDNPTDKLSDHNTTTPLIHHTTIPQTTRQPNHKTTLPSDNPTFPRLIAEHKADLKYTIVGAASILAKVTRDNYIDLLKEQFGEDFGSGYTSDPKTQKFLEKHWNNKNIYFFRKNWASWKNMKQKKEQKSIFDY